MNTPRHIIYSKLLLIATILSCTFSTSTVKGQDDVLAPFPYIFLLSDSCDIPQPITDGDFYTHAQGVIFPVNKYTIPEDDPWLRELQTQVEPWARQHALELKYIELRGAASPEGPLGWNTTLATNRSASLRDTLRTIFAVNYDLISPTTPQHPEDYSALLYQMRQHHDPDLALVERIINKNHHDRSALKEEIRQVNGGTLWKRLLREYFPNIRAARVVLYFKRKRISQNITAGTYNQPAPVLDSTPHLPPLILPAPQHLHRRELLSVKTNMLLDFAYMPFGYNAFCPIPNIAIEYYPLHGHFTYGAMFDLPWQKGNTSNHRYFQARHYTVETRYYLHSGDVATRGIGNGAAFKGTYLSAYANVVGKYGIGWADKKDINATGTLDGHGWQGEGAGAGLGIGYVMPLSHNQHWRLEFSAQFGLFWTQYDPYVYGCPVENTNDDLYYYDFLGDADLFQKRDYSMTWLGPTRIGVTISYDLLYRHNNKHRASFKASEKGGNR